MIENVTEYRGANLVDRDGDKVGTIEEIYLDRDTDRPEWALVKTGLLGSKSTFVPVAEADAQGDALRVPYEKSQIKDAPGVEPERELSEQEEAQLYRHYGLEYSDAPSDSGLPEGRSGDRSDVGHDVSGRETDEAMTRSEEELAVGTTQRERGRARLRKHVVTENVTTTVPVQREEVRIEREPITDANVGDATDGPSFSDEEHEVVLHEEEVVAEKRVVPKERIRMDKETVTDEAQVADEVRKEQVEVVDDDTTTGR